MTELKQTPLCGVHEAAGARLIDFGGWRMPVQYKPGIIKEHKAVRSSVGLFDVSHMGEFAIRGATAAESIQGFITNDVSKLADGHALYTVMCLDSGGIVDDLIVYREASDKFLLVVNASNIDKDLAWIESHVRSGTEVTNLSDDTALIAVQGPEAVGLVSGLADCDLDQVGRFKHRRCQIGGVPSLAARTGYTGEDGFELACAADDAVALWNALMDAGQSVGAQPIGLGARDTLRLEARLSLYGNDIDETTSPYEADLGWVVKPDAGDFVGRAALLAQKETGLTRKLVGFRVEGRGIPRHGYSIVDGDQPIGHVTSGTTGITVGGAIGLGYVPIDRSKVDSEITIDCRGKSVAARIVKGPFYKAPK